MPNPPLILVTEPLMQDSLRWLAERARVVEAAPGDALFSQTLSEADAMVVDRLRKAKPWTAETLRASTSAARLSGLSQLSGPRPAGGFVTNG